MALSIPVIFVSFSLCVSQSVFLERYREDQHVPVQVLTPVNRQVQSTFVLHSFSEFCVSFSFLLSREAFNFALQPATDMSR